MTRSGGTRPITADDATIRAMLADAPAAPLLPAIAAATGDQSVLRPELRPDPTRVLEPDGGLEPAELDQIRAIAFDALAAWRDRGCPPADAPDEATLAALMAHLVGDDNVGPYFGLLREELGLGGVDLRAPQWRVDDVAPGRSLQVVVIGAGMSGLLAAYRLRQAGVDVVVVDKNDDVGGTWLENTYPGCRVDVPNDLYSYSFAQRTWPEHFSSQPELLGYFRSFADDTGLRPLLRLGTEVTEVVFDDTRSVWSVHVRDRDGAQEVLEATAVISAVGQLNRPLLPDIEGIDTFEGLAFHSARWDHDVDLEGRAVAVIGTGASAAQFIPVVAERAGSLRIFQRTPNWLIPTPDYHERTPEGLRWLHDHLPGYGAWYRLWLFWRNQEGLLPMAVVDPDWPDQARSVSAANDLVRELLTAYLQAEFADAPDLLESVVPTYPPIAKRVIRDNGVWARTLRRDDVELVTAPIERVVADGIVTADGVHHAVDVIIYGTGFAASQFLTPMRVVGRDGVDLHEMWAGDARAYLGVSIPGFPNFFCLYGPNTNIVINGSIIYFSECEVHYVLEALRLLAERGATTLEVRADVHDAFNTEVDAANRQMAWGASSVNSWYKNATGRVAQNWPFSLREYWERTRMVDPDDYEMA